MAPVGGGIQVDAAEEGQHRAHGFPGQSLRYSQPWRGRKRR
jgi:hypothetical protein